VRLYNIVILLTLKIKIFRSKARFTLSSAEGIVSQGGSDNWSTLLQTVMPTIQKIVSVL
jgi:hypothetical protein